MSGSRPEAQPRRKRPRVTPGDIIEVILDDAHFRYIQYCSDSEHAQIVRVLPGKFNLPLDSELVAALASGPDDYLDHIFLRDFVRGDGIQVIGNEEIPKDRTGSSPIVLVWRPEDPGRGIVILGNGKSQLISDFASANPYIDLDKLPHNGIGTTPFRLKDGTRWSDVRKGELPTRATRPLPISLLPEQAALLALHRERADALIRDWYESFSRRSHYVRDESLKALDPETLVSVAICLLVPKPWDPGPQPPLGAEGEVIVRHMDRSIAPRMTRTRVLMHLERRTLPWSANDIGLLCALASNFPFHDELRFVAAVTRRYLKKMRRDTQVIESLNHLIAFLELHSVASSYSLGALKAVLASTMPIGHLDLSLIEQTDDFGPRATKAFVDASLNWPTSGTVLAHLAAARGSRPSKDWLARCAELGRQPEFSDLMRTVTDEALNTALTEPGTPGERLFSYSNEVIVRGAMWATPSAAGAWRIPVLGQLALRCGSKPSTATGILNSAVSLASIDALVLIGDDLSHAMLWELFDEAPNHGLVKKIGLAVGASELEIKAQINRLRSQKRTAIDRPWLGRWR